MNVVIVFESLFGNTHAIAEAVADGIRAGGTDIHVRVIRVGEVMPADVRDVALLVVGGPTHIHGMSSGTSRRLGLQNEEKEAESHGLHLDLEPGATGPGLRDWFVTLPRATSRQPAAAFDTRVDSLLSGGAAHGIARRLERHGYELVAEPEGFMIETTEGPLRKGERARAKQWGAALAGQLATARPSA